MVDYNYYKNTYLLGKSAAIGAVDFPFYERSALQEILKYTFGKTEELEELKTCICELAELIHGQEISSKKADIASEKVGEYSVSYSHESDSNRQIAVNKCIYKWLGNTGLLYSGV